MDKEQKDISKDKEQNDSSLTEKQKDISKDKEQSDSSLTEEQKDISNELKKIQIAQLHNATLNISNNSLETKKLVVTTITAVCTILIGLYKEHIYEQMNLLLALIFIIVMLFYIVDVCFYFYQDRLRENIDKKMNDIYREYQLKEIKLDKYEHRVRRSIFNYSQILYFLMMFLLIVISVKLNCLS